MYDNSCSSYHILEVSDEFIPFFTSSVLEAVFRRCFVKKMFLKNPQNSQENTIARVSFLIVADVRPATLLKKRLWHVFSCEFSEIFKNTFFIQHLRWMLL